MATPKKVIRRILRASIFGIVGVVAMFPWTTSQAANTPTFSQTINNGTLGVDVVDGSGNTVASPSVSFGALTFSFTNQSSTGTLGTASAKIRMSNPTGTATWSATIAATSGATATWSNGSSTFDFNDPTASATDGADADSVGGQLTVNASGATLAGAFGSCATTGLTLGSSTAFSEGVTNSVTLTTAGGTAATYCRWDLTNVALTQTIPAGQIAGAAYTIGMTLTIS